MFGNEKNLSNVISANVDCEGRTHMSRSEVFRAVFINMLSRARQCWEQGIAGMALLELEENDWLLAVCDDMLTRQNQDGRLCTVENTRCQTDPALSIQPVLRAWQLTGDARYRQAAERSMDFYRQSGDKTADGVLYHILGLPELWADSAAMLPASLAAMGEKQMAVQQMRGLCAKLRLENGLYAHRWNEAEQRFIRKQPWGAGNGWILVGLAWTIRVLGREDEHTPELMRLYADLSAALLPWRLPSGLYRDVLDDPQSFEECQTAAMQAYSAMVLHEEGLLDESVVPYAKATLDTVSAHVDPHGAIHDCPGSPEFVDNGTSTEMQAFWLMLYAVLRRKGAVQSVR